PPTRTGQSPSSRRYLPIMPRISIVQVTVSATARTRYSRRGVSEAVGSVVVTGPSSQAATGIGIHRSMGAGRARLRAWSARRALLPVAAGAPVPATSGELSAERVQVPLPAGAQLVEERVRLLQPGGIQGVQPARALGAHGGEPVLPEHPQVLTDCWLANAELGSDHLSHRAGWVLPAGEQHQDAPAHRVAEDVEGVHQDSAVGAACSAGGVV